MVSTWRLEGSPPLQPLATGDVYVPARIEATRRPTLDSPGMAVTIEIDDGAPVVTRVSFEAPPAGRVRTADLTGLRLSDLVAGAMGRLAFTPVGRGRYEPSTHHPESMNRAQRLLGEALTANARKAPAERLAEVAKVYRDGGRKPTLAVAEHFGVSPRTAGEWVKAARKAKLLPPARQGRISR